MNGYAMLIVAQANPQGPGLIQTVGFMAIIFALFYFMMIRPQTKREKERRKMIDAIKSGDRILFAGGIIGLVANVKDQILAVKIADNVKIEVARSSVIRVLEKDEQPGEQDKAG